MARTIGVGDEAFGGGNFTPIPVGTKIKVSVFEIEETTVKNGENAGKPQFVWTAKVTEEGPFQGRELRYNYVPLFAGAKNEFVLVTFAEAVGWKAAKGSGVEVPDDLNDVLGTELIVKVGQRTDPDKTNDDGTPVIYNTVRGTFPLGKGGGTPAAETPTQTWGSV